MAASIFNGNAVKILKNILRFKDGTELASSDVANLSGLSGNVQTQLDGKAATDLSNLASTAISVNLLPDSDNTREIGSFGSLEFNSIYTRNLGSANAELILGAGDVSGTIKLAVFDNATIAPRLAFPDYNNGFNAYIKAPETLAADYTLTLPPNDGSSGQFLKTDGSGNLSWDTVGAGISWNTPVDANIVPDTNLTYTVGSNTNNFFGVYTRNIESDGPDLYIYSAVGDLFLDSATSVILYSNNEDVQIKPYNATVAPTLKLFNANGNQSVGIKALDALAGSYTLTLPTNDGNSGEVLSTDGSGVLSWVERQAVITGAATTITSSNLTASRALASDGSGKVAVSSITSTELGYVSGVTSAIQTQLDGKLATTVTTKGDLITRTASAPTRLAVGTNGTFLKADSSATEGIVWTSTISTSATRSVTTTDSPTNADDVLILSGASFTVTLFTAVGNTGKILTLLHNGTSLTQVYTLNTTSGQTIGGIASGSYKLVTNGEVLKLISDGSNWLILEHKAETAATSFTPTGAFSTNVTYSGFWYRLGERCYITARLAFSGATNAATTFYLDFSALGTINTAKLLSTSTTDGAQQDLGRASFRDGPAENLIGRVLYRSTTTVSADVFSNDSATNHSIDPLTTTTPATIASGDIIEVCFDVPMTDWQP